MTLIRARSGLGADPTRPERAPICIRSEPKASTIGPVQRRTLVAPEAAWLERGATPVSLRPAAVAVSARLGPGTTAVPLRPAAVAVSARLDPETAPFPLRPAASAIGVWLDRGASVPLGSVRVAVGARLDPEAAPFPLRPAPVVAVTESVPLEACLPAVTALALRRGPPPIG